MTVTQQATAVTTGGLGISEQLESWNKPLSVGELAGVLHCSTKLLYKLAAAGRIPHYRVGSLIRFCPVAIARWLRARRSGRHVE